ncbi:MAG: ATP-binding protein [Sedimentisphaerales bacterium]
MESKPIKPKTMNIQQCLDVLESRDFNNLIGTIESEVLEFKGDLYQLDLEKEKLELAKDVSALANLSGGIILIGVGTSITEEHPHETIDRIRPFDESLINIMQYEDVIGSWIYPKINTEIKWIPFQTESQKGIVYIRIPETEVGKNPFLVTKILEENDKVLGNVVGFFQRKRDRVIHMTVQELQHVFKDGLRFDEKLAEVLETVRSRSGFAPMQIAPAETTPKAVTFTKTEKVVTEIVTSEIDVRLKKSIDEIGLANSTTYCLVAFPLEHIDMSLIFKRRDSNIVKLIENPPELRYAGFDLSSENSSKIINGKLRRTSLKSYKALEVWRDGTIIFVVDGDEGFLCWGNYKTDEFLRINTIALVESVYLFSLFVNKIFDLAEAPDCNILMELKIKNISKEKKYGLSRSKPGSFGWQFNLDRKIEWASERNLSVSHTWAWRNTSTESAAYELVSELYAKFGLEHEFIPYVKEQDSQKIIDVEQIKKIR